MKEDFYASNYVLAFDFRSILIPKFNIIMYYNAITYLWLL